MTLSTSADKHNSFQDVQREFTRHMRDPDNTPLPPGIEERRVEIYTGLLYRNVDSFMSSHYPVIKKILRQEQWDRLIRDYFKTHHAHTPLFPKMPQEFVQYLETPKPGISDSHPFLSELAHYEWIESSLLMDDREIDEEGVDVAGDLLAQPPILNQLAVPLQYSYPVHRISPDYIPVEAPEQPSYIIVYRNKEDSVKFLELNPVAARLVEYIARDTGQTGRQILSHIVTELQHPQPETVMNGGLDILLDLREKQILLGTKISV